jgi:hypothetical protein
VDTFTFYMIAYSCRPALPSWCQHRLYYKRAINKRTPVYTTSIDECDRGAGKYEHSEPRVRSHTCRLSTGSPRITPPPSSLAWIQHLAETTSCVRSHTHSGIPFRCIITLWDTLHHAVVCAICQFRCQPLQQLTNLALSFCASGDLVNEH